LAAVGGGAKALTGGALRSLAERAVGSAGGQNNVPGAGISQGRGEAVCGGAVGFSKVSPDGLLEAGGASVESSLDRVERAVAPVYSGGILVIAAVQRFDTAIW
jgi:hypothetical protein